MFSLLLIILHPNCSYLPNTSVIPNSSIWGNEKQVETLKQNYYDRIRPLELQDSYFGNTYTNQLNYYQNFSGHSQSYQDLYSAIRKAQTQEYIDNVRQSEKNGDVSQPVSYTAAGVGAIAGNPVKTSVNDIELSQTVNAINGTSQTTLKHNKTTLDLIINSRSSTDPATASINNTEIIQTKLQSPLPYNFFTTTTYGSTTQEMQVSLNHAIYKNITGTVSKTWCVNPAISAEMLGSIGYGVNF